MSLRKNLSTVAIAMAILPVVARAQTVLFSDNYDAGTSQSRYDFYTIDNQTTPATYGAGTIAGDLSANFSFDYGAYTFRGTAPDGITPTTGFIPSAPRSTGGSTVGLRFDANNTPAGTAIINAYPKLTQFLGGVAPSGDHKLTFDIWMNYNGGFEGGGGSTEWMITGINQDANGIGAARLGQEPAGVSRGFGMAVNGERGNGLDYRFYRDNTRFGTIGVPEAGYVATPDPTFGIANGENPFYQTLFPFPDYETPGSIGKRWNTVEIEYTDGIVYHRINGNLISARTDRSVTGGNILLGYGDFNNTAAANDDITGVDANFGIYDNVEVTAVTQVRPRYVGPGDGIWGNAANWVNGVPDSITATADFVGAATDSSLGGPTVVNVDGTRTVRSIIFENAPYQLTGGTIAFNSLTTGIVGDIVVRSSSQFIDSTVDTVRPLVLNVAVGSTLSISGDLLLNNNNVTKDGEGSAAVKNLRTTGTVLVNQGTLRVASNGGNAGASSIATLSIAGATDAWTAKFDLADNSVIVDYTGTSPLATIINQLKSGRAGGAWNGNGIMSGTAAVLFGTGIGYAESVEELGVGGGTFGGLPADDTAVLLKLTRVGDADLSGTTDIDDFGALAANFNQPGVWNKGDFDYSGTVDIDDFGLLAANFNQGFPASGGRSAIPEPSALSLLTALAFVRRRRA